MNSFSMYDVLSHSVWVMLLTSLPILLVAMIVGLVIGILQTATSIQEQTLIFIPKIVAVLAALVLFGPWIFGQVGDLTRFLLGQLEKFIQ
ncbi:flagellar biosynthesis protein FliQ [Aminobacterium mobile]|jgi:flagellar biosynthetic protein FliQ|uniref:flagellar biosynthesis protein FliQ n=1 Tax=Aminobacterium mobile TaxID=81467 RepID=UPI0004677491|nr:flagellar biosynthesis protein FliQ [Aminobacterium mobile]